MSTSFFVIINNQIHSIFLLMRAVDKWRKHRRVITSAFDTKLLEKFITTFNEKNRILIKNMREELNKPVKFNLFEYISQTTVDTICGKYSLVIIFFF